MPTPEVSVIIPTMKGREAMLQRLIASIGQVNGKGVEIVVVTDEDILLAAKRNKGAMRAQGEYLLFIDDDNYLEKDAIKIMLRYFGHRTGVMGMVACYSDKKNRIADGGSDRHYVSGFMSGRNTNKHIEDVVAAPYEVDEVANAFMIRRDLFWLVNGFDEKNFPIDLDEADICKRIKDNGYTIEMNPRAICYHNSVTYSCIPDFRRPMNAYFMGRNRILYQKKHLNAPKLLIYFVVFFPVFVVSYTVCLIARRKPWMVKHFIMGVIDGILGRKENPYQ